MIQPKSSLVDVAPKDIQFLVEFNSGAIKALKIILDNMTFNYNSSNQEHFMAKEYLESQFYPLIQQANKTLEGV